MNRRRFVGLAAGALWLTRYAWAQPSPIKQVAVLLAGSRETDELAIAPFFDQMQRLGWIEGRNISYERFFALGSRDKMVELARAAAAKSPDLVYAPTGHAAGSATKATKTIPVVFVTVSDPMVTGLVASLARPGGNATGTFQIQADW